MADYASAKGGIIAFTRNAARELLSLNIQVNAVLPVAHSRMTDALADFHARFSGEDSASRLRNLAPPDAVLPVFLFLASSDADYVTGTGDWSRWRFVSLSPQSHTAQGVWEEGVESPAQRKAIKQV